MTSDTAGLQRQAALKWAASWYKRRGDSTRGAQALMRLSCMTRASDRRGIAQNNAHPYVLFDDGMRRGSLARAGKQVFA